MIKRTLDLTNPACEQVQSEPLLPTTRVGLLDYETNDVMDILQPQSRFANEKTEISEATVLKYWNPEETYWKMALIRAAFQGKIEIVKFLVAAGADLDYKCKIGSTALIWASRFGNPQIVQSLILAGAKIDFQSCQGFTALIWACNQGYATIAQQLVNAGANLNCTEKLHRHTALDKAVQWNNHEIVALLEQPRMC